MKYKDYADLFGDKYIKLIFKLLTNKGDGGWDPWGGAVEMGGGLWAEDFYEYFDNVGKQLRDNTAISRTVLFNNPGIHVSGYDPAGLRVCGDSFYLNKPAASTSSAEHGSRQSIKQTNDADKRLRRGLQYQKIIDLNVFIDNPPIKWKFQDAIRHNPNFDTVIMRNVIDGNEDDDWIDWVDYTDEVGSSPYEKCKHQYHPIYSFIKDRFISGAAGPGEVEHDALQRSNIQDFCDLYDDSFTIQTLKCIIWMHRTTDKPILHDGKHNTVLVPPPDPGRFTCSGTGHGTTNYLDWYQISKHKNITGDDIINNSSRNFRWNRRGVCENPNITPEMLTIWLQGQCHPDRCRVRRRCSSCPENWTFFSNNPNITISYILKNKTNTYWDWFKLSGHPNIDVDSIFENADLPWLFRGVSANPTLKMRHVMQNLDKDWDWSILSRNIEIDYSPIYFNEPSSIKWNYKELSANKSIHLDIVKEQIDKKWDWHKLSKNPAITLAMIEENIELPWKWWSMSKNSNLTWEFVKKYIHKAWDAFELTKHNNFTLDIIYNNLIHSYGLNNPDIREECSYIHIGGYHPMYRVRALGALQGTEGRDNIIDNITAYHPQINTNIFDSIVHFGKHTLWNIKYFVENNNFDCAVHGEFLLKYIPKDSSKWETLSNKRIPIEFIINNIDRNWDWDLISMRKDLTFDIILKTLQFSPRLKTNKSEYILPNTDEYDALLKLNQAPPGFSKRKNKDMAGNVKQSSRKITITNYGKDKIIEQHTSWNWSLISENPNITWKDVLGYSKYIPWDWDVIMKSNLITEEIINNYSLRWTILNKKPIHEWNPYHLCHNINISHEFIIDYINNSLSGFIATLCTDQSGGFCPEHLKDRVVTHILQHHNNLDTTQLKTFSKLSDKSNYTEDQMIALSKNDSLDIDYIENNLGANWSIVDLSKNNLEISKEKWIHLRRLQYIKALQIQRHWRNCSCNPVYKLAQRCLLRLHMY
jgi:hypothetical protein